MAKLGDGFEEIKCDSSNIHSAAYSKEAKVLILRFKDRNSTEAKSAYEYENVPETLWAQFKSAPSKGKFAQDAIIAKFTGGKIWQR